MNLNPDTHWLIIRVKSHRARAVLKRALLGIGNNLYSWKRPGEFYAVTEREFALVYNVPGIGRVSKVPLDLMPSHSYRNDGSDSGFTEPLRRLEQFNKQQSTQNAR